MQINERCKMWRVSCDRLMGRSQKPLTFAPVLFCIAIAVCRTAKGSTEVYTWGSQNLLPANLTNVVAIAMGHNHSLALNRDGTISAWGYDGEGPIRVPSGLTNVVAISAG